MEAMNEPIIHSHLTDTLPEDHPLAHETVYCRKCGVMVHAFNNECMRTWVQIRGVPFCITCALPCFETVMTYAPLWEHLEHPGVGQSNGRT